MANKILISETWMQRIRDKLGIDIAYIPDSVVQQPDIITIAETNIIRIIPDYETLLDDDKVYLESAVICECCALLCPSMSVRLPIKEQGPSETHELSVNWDKKKNEFEVEKNNYIGKISTVNIPTLLHFGLSQ